MKTSLTLILGIAVLATLGGLATAEPTTVKGSKSNADNRVAASPKLITGKVSQVDPKTRTYTLQAKGKEYKFAFEGWNAAKVGAVVDVTYTGTLSGSEPCESINLNSSKSNIY